MSPPRGSLWRCIEDTTLYSQRTVGWNRIIVHTGELILFMYVTDPPSPRPHVSIDDRWAHVIAQNGAPAWITMEGLHVDFIPVDDESVSVSPRET